MLCLQCFCTQQSMKTKFGRVHFAKKKELKKKSCVSMHFRIAFPISFSLRSCLAVICRTYWRFSLFFRQKIMKVTVLLLFLKKWIQIFSTEKHFQFIGKAFKMEEKTSEDVINCFFFPCKNEHSLSKISRLDTVTMQSHNRRPRLGTKLHKDGRRSLILIRG